MLLSLGKVRDSNLSKISNTSARTFMSETMTTHLLCAIAALLSLHFANFGTARATPAMHLNADELIADPVIGPPVILPEPLPLIPIGPAVAPPVTQPELLPLIPGPGGTWRPSAQPEEEDSSSDSVPNPMPQEHAPPVEFDYSDGPNGPDHWGELKPNWALCKSGSQQSPLSITPSIIVTDSSLGNLKANYSSEPVDATISHDGHALKVDLPSSAGVLKIYNVTYRPVSFHFHRPSEHRILNYSFPLELHLVHKSEEGRIAVVAWLFVPGSANNTFLTQFLDELPTHKNPYASLKIPPIKLLQLEPNYGRYRGSLTTPPCSETVIWTLMLWNFPSVSDYQLKQLKAAMPKKNVRPSFPSNGRKFCINHTPNWTLMEQAFKDMTSP